MIISIKYNTINNSWCKWEIHTHLKCSVTEEPFPYFHIKYPTKKIEIFNKLNCMKTGNGNKIIYK